MTDPASDPASVAVIGAGSWGTTLAVLLSRKGHRVRLWAHEPEVVEEIAELRENRTFLPGVPIPDGVVGSGELAEALDGAEFVVSVTPAQFTARVMKEAAPHIEDDATTVSASKGIEISTLRRMDEVHADVLRPGQMERFAVLSGPSFAVEVAREEPTAVTVASRSEFTRHSVQNLFQTGYFRVYTSVDVVGVELGGALKNVVALAAGVVSGLGFGHNTLAALVTRGLAEMKRLGMAVGAEPSTFAGLSGLGDLVLTCTGDLSRNRTVGRRLGAGETLDEILGETKTVAEGVKTVEAVRELARRHDVEMPIAEEVHAILHRDRSPAEAVRNLMLRDPKPEEWA